MIKWLVNMHNSVNKSNNKRIYTVNDLLKIHVKNKSMTIKSNMIIKFIKEYIYYNIQIGKSKNAIKLLHLLAIIYPDPRKRPRIIKYIKTNKNKNILQYLNGYIKLL